MVPAPLVRPLLRRRLRLLEERAARYRTQASRAEVERVQLEALNRVWARARERYAFYRGWQREHALPERLGSLAELDVFPVLRKAHLQEAAPGIFRDAGPCRTVATGGSTGEPTRFPASKQDLDGFFANAWTARSWFGLRPLARVVLIWGHAHLLEGGPAPLRTARRTLRRVQDGLMNTVRLDAYRLSRDSAGRYLDALRRNPGAVVVSYASAFEKLLDHMDDAGVERPPWAPSHVILTSERVEPSTPRRVRERLGSVPVVEYGTGELGVLAYSTPDALDLRFLWASFHGRVAGEDELVVTTLDPRLFPLIHYGTGDRVADADDRAAVLSCREVLGRRNDAVRVPRRHAPPLEVHSELFTHAVKAVAGVRAFVVVEDAESGSLELRLMTEASRLEDARARVLSALGREVPDLDGERIAATLLEQEPLTLAGKRKFIERVGSPGP